MSKVSRSVYQKTVEENKRLMKDLELIVSDNGIDTYIKWANYFEDRKRFDEFLMMSVKQYVVNNPNDPAVIASNNIITEYKNN